MEMVTDPRIEKNFIQTGSDFGLNSTELEQGPTLQTRRDSRAEKSKHHREVYCALVAGLDHYHPFFPCSSLKQSKAESIMSITLTVLPS